MYEELARLLTRYYKDNKEADESFVTEVQDIIKNTKGYEDVINKIIYKRMLGLGCYTRLENNIYLSNKIKKHKRICYVNNEYDSKPLNNNIWLLNSVFHELDHALLFRELRNGEMNIMTKLATLCDLQHTELEYEDKSYKELFHGYNNTFKYMQLYNKYHDYAPYETRAILKAYDEILKLIHELLNSDIDSKELKFIEKAIKYQKEYDLVERYKLEYFENGISDSLSYNYCENIDFRKEYFPDELNLYLESHEKSFIEDSKNYSLNERILYGLQISEDELNSIVDLEKIKKEKSHEISLFEGKLLSLSMSINKKGKDRK